MILMHVNLNTFVVMGSAEKMDRRVKHLSGCARKHIQWEEGEEHASKYMYLAESVW